MPSDSYLDASLAEAINADSGTIHPVQTLCLLRRQENGLVVGVYKRRELSVGCFFNFRDCHLSQMTLGGHVFHQHGLRVFMEFPRGIGKFSGWVFFNALPCLKPG
jgi:hypothetical protein